MSRRPISILRSKAAYEAALEEYESYFDKEPRPGTPDADRFELLGFVLAKYESENHPVPEASPLDVLKLAMEQKGYSQSDLADLIGSRSRASEILSGKRELNLRQIRLLAREWHIPAACLIGALEVA